MKSLLTYAETGFARRVLRIALALVAACMTPGISSAAETIGTLESSAQSSPALPRIQIDMKGSVASAEVVLVANWIMRKNKHQGHPYIIADKVGSLLFAFDAHGILLAATPALFGEAHSDVLTEAQADKTLEETLKADKITPAGLFDADAYLSPSYGKSVRFAGYTHTNLLIHRAPDATRLRRLQSPTTSDNRITYGCINVLPEFVDKVLLPNFSGKSTVVVLPETQSAESFFAMNDATEAALHTLNVGASE